MKVCALILTLTLFVAAPVFAGKSTPTASADTMTIVRDAVKSKKKAFVAVNMKLTDEEGKQFWPLYDKYQNELARLNTETGDLITSFANTYEKMTDKAALKLVQKSIKIEKQRSTLRKDYLGKFKSALPGKKVARYYQLENKIQAVLKYELAEAIPLVGVNLAIRYMKEFAARSRFEGHLGAFNIFWVI